MAFGPVLAGVALRANTGPWLRFRLHSPKPLFGKGIP